MRWPNENGNIQFIELDDLFNPDFYYNAAKTISEKIKEREGQPFSKDSSFRSDLIKLLGSEYYEIKSEAAVPYFRGTGKDWHRDNIKGNLNHYYFSWSGTYGFNTSLADKFMQAMLRPETLHLSLIDALEQGALDFEKDAVYTDANGNSWSQKYVVTNYGRDEQALNVYNRGITTRIPLETIKSWNMDFSIIQGSTKVLDTCNPDYISEEFLNGTIRVLPYCMAVRHDNFIDALHTLANEVGKCKPITESARDVIKEILAKEASSIFRNKNRSSYYHFGDTVDSISSPFNIIFRTVCYNDWNEHLRETMDVEAIFTEDKRLVFKVSRNEQAEK